MSHPAPSREPERLDDPVDKAAAGLLPVVREGFRAAWPICLGYFPIGLAFGVLAQKAGIGPLGVGLMSLLVFAGSAQFIAVSMLAQTAALTSIVLTTFLVNLRHLLMSSALSVYLRHSSWRFLCLFSHGITDESFAVNMTQFREGNWSRSEALTVNLVSHAAWVGSTILGAYGGQFIPTGAFGIDYALPAMFLCLLVFQLRGRLYAVTAIVAGTLAVILALLIPGNTHIMLAAILAASFGFALRRSRIAGRKR